MTSDDRLTFGKYAGGSVRDVMDVDPEYIERALNAVHRFGLDNEAMCYLAQRFWNDAIAEERISSFPPDRKRSASTGKP